ncbi:MAG: c-type cytochrome [Ferruginibacter sp.]|nr:c-type cytochrome [Ferruginibacter sp.]
MKKVLVITLILFSCMAFLTFSQIINDERKPAFIPPSKQRTGDATKGYVYLITGDYLKSGIPFNLFLMGIKKDSNNYLNRTGNNKNLPYDYTAVKAPNGEQIVAPNCLQCHAQVFDGKLIVGLGNTFTDFTVNRNSTVLFAEKFLKTLQGENAKKYDAAKNFITAIKTIAPSLITTTKGVNLADAMAALLVAHRDPITLKWSNTNLIDIPNEIIPTDVPAWWLLKKKNAMFYNGLGRGDFGRFLMASNLLTVTDSSEAAEVDTHFNDVLAYINSIQPPKYPNAINVQMAAKGKTVFKATCKKCHGSYGENASYPNLLIPENIIQTDSALYSSNYSNAQFVDWFNGSWFTTGDHPAKLVPYKGYIAPPLDGIWVTAPYLHNGSVPNLETLLNSRSRPKFWKRSFSNPSYNYEIPGYNYEINNEASGNEVYNTTQKGFSNAGHYFGDKLSEKERRAVIEYLKTL